MLTKSLIKALTAANYEIKKEKNHYKVETESIVVDWYDQEGYAVAVGWRYKHDLPDAMSDYFPYFRCDTIKEALSVLGQNK